MDVWIYFTFRLIQQFFDFFFILSFDHFIPLCGLYKALAVDTLLSLMVGEIKFVFNFKYLS